ncbi:MAG TPA: ATP-binding cassette domain-containing protein [Candidatus Limnocylindria bacterium]|nr:ATP-binding cassette domain-containing protein [Candidatus Limnocylindria bacterium]
MSVLTINGLTKSFRGFVAVHDVSLDLNSGELRGLIGANGAGKSTLLHLIYGRLQADRGSIRFGDTDVAHLPAHERARLGMGLVFQVTSVFDDLTVEENLLLGALPKVRGTNGSVDRGEVERVLELIQLADVRSRRARHLSHGQQRWLEIGMVLLTQPKLLLLDEPTSGMTRAESRSTAALLRELQAAGAAEAIIVVEHNIEFIRLVSDRVTVMHRGQVLADGTIDEVQANLEVQASYLGRRH